MTTPGLFFPAVRGTAGHGPAKVASVPPSGARLSVQSAAAKSLVAQPLVSLLQPTPGGPNQGASAQTPTKRMTSASKLRQEIAAATSQLDTPTSSQSSSRSVLSDESALGLRITDARLESIDSAHVSQPSVWAQLNMEDINAGLSAPLTSQEIALNRVASHGRSVIGGKKAREDVLAEHAHRGVDVSRLVDSYPLEFGTSVVGSRARILFLQLENTAAVTPANKPSRAAEIASPLDQLEGEVIWRARWPHELETPVERWATLSSDPTDEERYHDACVDREIFTIRPASGRLASGQRMQMEITYHPKFSGEHVVPLLVQVRGGKHFTLILKGTTVQHQLPSVFSFTHLRETTPFPALTAPANGEKGREESKEESLHFLSAASAHANSSSPFFSNPFLPARIPPSYEYQLHPVPIGLQEKEAPIQTFQLYNNSTEGLAYRISRATMRALAKENYDVDVLTLCQQGAGETATTDGAQADVEGLVPPHSAGVLRFRFRPLEAKSYECAIHIAVRGEAERDEETVQTILFRGDGLFPSDWSVSAFPSESRAPPAQVLSLPGQLVEVSTDEVHLGDLPLFARASRIFTLRSLQPRQPIEFAMVHTLRLPPKRWSASLRAERAIRRAINDEEEEEDDGIGEGDEEEGDTDATFDPDESVHVSFFPPGGVLGPGESLQVRCDVHAGDRPVILERNIQIFVRVLQEEEFAGEGTPQQMQQHQQQQPQGNGRTTTSHRGGTSTTASLGSPMSPTSLSSRPVDTFGYHRAPSTRLAQRPGVTSSQPLDRKQPRGRINMATGEQSRFMTGVGSGRAGTDVRVEEPERRVAPGLHSSTITRRTNRTAADGAGATTADGSPSSHHATAHLHSHLASLHSIPSRATWFADSTAPVSGLLARTTSVLHLFLRGRILPMAVMEKAEAIRSQSGTAGLPQQQRTELTVGSTEVAQRFFIPRVELALPMAAAAAPAQPVETTLAGVAAIEAALHELLRAGLQQTSVQTSFQHLTLEPVPLFTDLLAASASTAHHHHHPTAPPASLPPPAASASSSSSFSSGASLSSSSCHFQNLSESILRDTLGNLMVEASSTESGWALDKQLPKTFVKRPTQ